MKIAMITDQHFGVRNNSPVFFDYFSRFYETMFFPYLEKNGIDTVVNLGDHLDNRKSINVLAGQKFDDLWIQNLTKRDMTEHALIGNHTVYYRNTNSVNSLSQFYRDKKDLHLYDVSPKEVEIGGRWWGMVPWITADNKDECLEFIRKTKATILCGHFEIIGFYMDGGHKCESGLSVSELTRFDRVFSGHFHKKQTVSNVSYLGSPYDMTYTDLGEQKGFHVFDTDTLDIEFIPNPEKMFHRLYYDDLNNDYDFSEYDFTSLKNTYVKIVVLNKKDDAQYQTLLDKLEEAQVHKIDINDTIIQESDVISEVDMSLSTVEIINNYIDDSESVNSKEELKKLISMIYTEAINM